MILTAGSFVLIPHTPIGRQVHGRMAYGLFEIRVGLQGLVGEL